MEKFLSVSPPCCAELFLFPQFRDKEQPDGERWSLVGGTYGVPITPIRSPSHG